MSEILFDFEIGNKDTGLTFFDDGTLTAGVYSYETNSTGYIELNKEKTRELYDAMHKYFTRI